MPWFFVFLICVTSGVADGANILLLSAQCYSHMANLHQLGEILHKHNGHVVSFYNNKKYRFLYKASTPFKIKFELL